MLFPSSVTNVGGLSNLLKASFFFSAFQIEGGLAPLSLLLVLVLLSVVIFLLLLCVVFVSFLSDVEFFLYISSNAFIALIEVSRSFVIVSSSFCLSPFLFAKPFASFKISVQAS